MEINAFIVEEHHEAFIVWSHALKTGQLSKNSSLLHFDDHADFRTPIFERTINDLFDKSMEVIHDFVYGEMKIDTFIAPAIYLGLFNEFTWIKQGQKKSSAAEMYIRSFNNQGKKLLLANTRADGYEMKPFKYAKLPSSIFRSLPDSPAQGVALDIDLDYFSCCENPSMSNSVVIEITESEYMDFVSNKYHYLHFVTGHIRAVNDNGNFFYIINGYNEKYASEREVKQEVISERIDEFINDLSFKNIKPDIITICRSRFSGFTPEHQWEYIESKLTSELSGLYQIRIKEFTK